MEFVRLICKNNPPGAAVLEGHQAIIKDYVEKGYQYLGFVPVKFGPSGKTLEIDLIFKK